MSAPPEAGERITLAGYVKLAKLWERSRNEAIAYHTALYENRYKDSTQFHLVDVYIDITGQKEIRRRPEMLRLIRDCISGKVQCISAQTSGYLAANPKEFSYLLKLLFEIGDGVNIITEDRSYNINTLVNDDQQREALYKMACDLVELNPDDYTRWHEQIVKGMNGIVR
jgi:hypothetical protein